MINYAKIAKAIEYYNLQGYEYIEVPWIVGKDAIDVTKPQESRYFETTFGHLVGSGEQSFLQIYNQLLSGRKYQCVTPCFRDEVNDDLHKMWFIKLELIQVLEKGQDFANMLQNVINDAWNFFNQFANEKQMQKTKQIDNIDIEINGIEVGSYGIRKHQNYSWIYGTGLAEPRFSTAIKAHQALDPLGK